MGETNLELSDRVRADLERDARDLRKGVLYNFLGYAIRAAHPLLFLAVIRAYGAEALGVFALSQAALLLLQRVCLMGFDKSLVWWIPRLPAQAGPTGLWAIAARVLGASCVVSALVAGFCAPLIASWSGDPRAAAGLRLMALALPAMVLLELLVHAVIGTRDMSSRAIVRDGFVPLAHVGLALVLFLAGMHATGLALSFALAQVLGLGAAVWLYRRAFAGRERAPRSLALPPELRRYALALWGVELASSLLARLDVYAVAQLGQPALVGVYAAVLQVANTLRSVRQAFDPIVLTLFSAAGVSPDRRRLIAGFSRATVAVAATQAPIFALFVCFGRELLGLLGPGFDAGVSALVILGGGMLVNGVIGMHGLVVLSMGRSDLTLWNTLLTLPLLSLLLWALVPGFGTAGAAAAVALAYAGNTLVQWYQGYRLTGVQVYDASVPRLLAVCGLASAALALAWLLLLPLGSLIARGAALASFLAVGGLGLWRLHAVARGGSAAT